MSAPSCNGQPELATIDERGGSVHIEVVTLQVVNGDRDACLDGLQNTLDAQLADRELIDLVSGELLPVASASVGDLECFDADYPFALMVGSTFPRTPGSR